MKLRAVADFLMRLFEDRRGVSAVEFALIAPVIIGFYFGLGELCQGYMAQKRLAHTASSVANLMAQTTNVVPTDVDDVMGIGSLIMKPFPTTSLSIRVSSVTRDSKGVARIDWSRASGPGLVAYKRLDVVTVPTQMIANEASLVMAETTYDYESPVKYLLPKLTTLSNTFYELPRKVPQVTCPTC